MPQVSHLFVSISPFYFMFSLGIRSRTYIHIVLYRLLARLTTS
nr:MAG TPA: hypothetical protein [Caudoviricetes sp.]